MSLDQDAIIHANYELLNYSIVNVNDIASFPV